MAITRAKRGLIVIGSRETLKSDYYWALWLKHWDEQVAKLINYSREVVPFGSL